ncbi:dnaA protein [Meinhardsimonia xiamenensis]|uniref:DnaA protein n=1 Tax=Meinhardsimonia xiamenensis TaxID=990712 RepID=A0A1G9BJ37_9RHOB|nr:DnaA/Hda family protein [Meinhardsimonia xiamenensis]PRX34981.1 DnaA protein [Meinhardsimonia xiamenensis]SDK38865.1 dnaA protein [Meinhardsimonia xiamenensis]
MTRQLPLPLPSRTSLGRGDFFVSAANAEALAALDGWRDWPDARLALVGPEGAGKSHLVAVWAQETGARVLAWEALDTAAIAGEIGESRPIALEDADRLAGDAEGERALFHLLNLCREARRPLLLTARRAPAHWPATLPDLASRLQAMSVARLAPPDDALLAAVLVKLFADRQIRVGPELVTWLARRIDRSFAAAQAAVAALDAVALAEKRPVTRALAARVLQTNGQESA